MSTPISDGVGYQALFDHSPNPYVVLTPELVMIAANEAYLRVTGRTREEIIGRGMFEAFPGDPEAGDEGNVRELRASFERVLATAKPDTLALIRYAIPRRTEQGTVFEERFWSATHTPLLDAHGRVEYILQHTEDITELQQLKQAARLRPVAQQELGVFRRAQAVQRANHSLDAERRHLRRLFEQAPGFVAFLRGPQHVFELVNQAYYQLIGHRDLVGRPAREGLPEVRGQGYFELLDRVYTSGEAFLGHGMRALLQRRPDAPPEEVYMDLVYQPVLDQEGAVTGIFVQGHDVTEQYRAQQELAEYRDHLEELVAERTRALEESEAALRHAQKMEAVGRLTGGVAHDFNNLLQVIGSNLQLLQRDPDGSRAQQRIATAWRAVERGAKVASHLLAFARRQPLEPTVLDLGRLLERAEELLRRAVDETVRIELELDPQLWRTYADPSQLEAVLLNLAINARDAMNGAGTLRIAAANRHLSAEQAALWPDLQPGDYLELSLVDNGCGMSPEVLEQALEPFFTTKPEGRGTGLGLSMAYGFIRQSGGQMRLDSSPGQGTTVTIYLPRCAAEEAAPQPPPADEQVLGGSERILVVEDDAELRASVADTLGELGYQVLQAADGAEALGLLRAGEQVDLLFSDVVMPGPVRSTELAAEAQAILPGLEVLFTSGYAKDGIVHDGRLDPGVRLLRKPYRREELARKLREILSAPGAAAVLLVEDDLALREAAADSLRLLGRQVVAVGDGEAALEALGRDEYALLLTDLGLPGPLSGAALAARARALQPRLGVIVASGRSQREVSEAVAGSVFLAKPYDVDAVAQALDQATALRSGPAGIAP